MSDTDPNLDLYCRRIGYRGPLEPTLATLRALQARHAAAIPFENFDPLLRRPVRLDPASLEDKLLRRGRGGYCFEQNGLFARVLAAIGFDLTPLSARVRLGTAEDAPTSRSHMTLAVHLPEGTHIADVGFGGFTPAGPLRLDARAPVTVGLSTFRIVEHGAGYELQGLAGEAWLALYRFTAEPAVPPDYEMANWYVSTHPTSRFVRNLIVARQDGDRRYAVLNGQITTYHADGRIEERAFRDFDDLADTAARCLGLDLSRIIESDAERRRVEAAIGVAGPA